MNTSDPTILYRVNQLYGFMYTTNYRTAYIVTLGQKYHQLRLKEKLN